MIRALAGIVLVLVLAAGACSQDGATVEDNRARQERQEKAHASSPAPATKPAAAPRPRPAQLTRVTLKALGMYCEESCPLKVRNALADVDAVYELGFDLSTESIFVSYDAALGDAKTVTKPMIAAIKSAGFDPWLKGTGWPSDAVVQPVHR